MFRVSLCSDESHQWDLSSDFWVVGLIIVKFHRDRKHDRLGPQNSVAFMGPWLFQKNLGWWNITIWPDYSDWFRLFQHLKPTHYPFGENYMKQHFPPPHQRHPGVSKKTSNGRPSKSLNHPPRRKMWINFDPPCWELSETGDRWRGTLVVKQLRWGNSRRLSMLVLICSDVFSKMNDSLNIGNMANLLDIHVTNSHVKYEPNVNFKFVRKSSFGWWFLPSKSTTKDVCLSVH